MVKKVTNVKKRKIKKSVKIIFFLVILNSISICFALAEYHKKVYFEKNVYTLRQENRSCKKELNMKNNLLSNPQQAYSFKIREKLKHDKLPHWLLLQTDERWAYLPYGWGEDNSNLAMNGCTIDALAIVNSLINDKETSPKKILSWSKNKYFTDEGTSWSIYKDFSKEHNYHYKDLGTDIENTQFYLKKNIPVIAAAQPGIFTTIGHTLVLTHFDNNGYRLLDPSDNYLKNHSLTTYSEAVLRNEMIHFWTIYK